MIERNRPDRHFRLGRRLLRQDHGRLQERGQGNPRGNHRAPSAIGTTSMFFSRAPRSLPAAMASAASRASSCCKILQKRASSLGVKLVFETEITDPDDYAAHYDLVIASDGASSITRRKYEQIFKPNIQVRQQPLYLAGQPQKTGRLHLRLQGNRMGLVQPARLSLRRRVVHVHC